MVQRLTGRRPPPDDRRGGAIERLHRLVADNRGWGTLERTAEPLLRWAWSSPLDGGRTPPAECCGGSARASPRGRNETCAVLDGLTQHFGQFAPAGVSAGPRPVDHRCVKCYGARFSGPRPKYDVLLCSVDRPVHHRYRCCDAIGIRSHRPARRRAHRTDCTAQLPPRRRPPDAPGGRRPPEHHFGCAAGKSGCLNAVIETPVHALATGESNWSGTDRHKMFTVILIGFVGGVITAVSPCILPVLPVNPLFREVANRHRQRCHRTRIRGRR